MEKPKYINCNKSQYGYCFSNKLKRKIKHYNFTPGKASNYALLYEKYFFFNV